MVSVKSWTLVSWGCPVSSRKCYNAVRGSSTTVFRPLDKMELEIHPCGIFIVWANWGQFEARAIRLACSSWYSVDIGALFAAVEWSLGLENFGHWGGSCNIFKELITILTCSMTIQSIICRDLVSGSYYKVGMNRRQLGDPWSTSWDVVTPYHSPSFFNLRSGVLNGFSTTCNGHVLGTALSSVLRSIIV